MVKKTCRGYECVYYGIIDSCQNRGCLFGYDDDNTTKECLHFLKYGELEKRFKEHVL